MTGTTPDTAHPPLPALPFGTPVHTPYGDMPVDLLQPEQVICSAHLRDMKRVPAKTLTDQVHRVCARPFEGTLTVLELPTGRTLHLPPWHPVRTPAGWTPAAHLNAEDLIWIWAADRPCPRELRGVSETPYSGHLYTVETRMYGTHFASHLLVRAHLPEQPPLYL